jgi:hypothetical protein
MPAEHTSALSAGTTDEDYSAAYYAAHLGEEADYGWHNEAWRSFFRQVADRLVAALNPTTSLDVGCAKGLLVQALLEKHVDARGFDISSHAIESATPEVRDRLRVGSATEPIEGRWSLISCIEVLEHLSPVDAQTAIDNMCAATDLILFSSSPTDFQEPTHVNVNPTATWVRWFAERGFYRRTDVNLSFLSPWAVLLERGNLGAPDVVQRYETQYVALHTEVLERRRAMLEQFREDGRHDDPELVAARDKVLDLERQLLSQRDHVIGSEATAARATIELDAKNRALRALRSAAKRQREHLESMRKELKYKRFLVKKQERQLAEARKRVRLTAAELAQLRGSRSMKVGRFFTRPFRR